MKPEYSILANFPVSEANKMVIPRLCRGDSQSLTLAQQKESRIEEGHLLVDHVPRLISIPPKYAVAQVVGFSKGKSAIHLARNFGGRQRNFTGCSFWARGYDVSTAGRDEETIRRYLREQQVEDKRVEQLKMFND